MELGDLLLPAFDTKTGIPKNRVNFKTRKNTGDNKSVLAEIGTLQVWACVVVEVLGVKDDGVGLELMYQQGWCVGFMLKFFFISFVFKA